MKTGSGRRRQSRLRPRIVVHPSEGPVHRGGQSSSQRGVTELPGARAARLQWEPGRRRGHPRVDREAVTKGTPVLSLKISAPKNVPSAITASAAVSSCADRRSSDCPGADPKNSSLKLLLTAAGDSPDFIAGKLARG